MTFRENNTVVESTSGSHAVCLLTHGGFTFGKVRCAQCELASSATEWCGDGACVQRGGFGCGGDVCGSQDDDDDDVVVVVVVVVP